MKKISVGYFADGPWSHEALKRITLDETIKIKFICARDDMPDEILKSAALKLGIDFFTHPRINSDDFYDQVSGYECDLFVSMSFNQIFKSKLINLPPLKIINCHAGKLPFYRGRNVLNWVLINDEREFGITVHYVDEGIDTGDIILQRCYPISDADDYATVLERAYEGCAANLYSAIKLLQAGKVTTKAQHSIDQLGFYCTARQAGDERLDWNQKSRDIFNLVRAICRPGPEARTFLGETEIRINKVLYLSDAPIYRGIAGAVVGVEFNAFYVKTSDSFVKVTEWSGYSRPRVGDRFK